MTLNSLKVENVLSKNFSPALMVDSFKFEIQDSVYKNQLGIVNMLLSPSKCPQRKKKRPSGSPQSTAVLIYIAFLTSNKLYSFFSSAVEQKSYKIVYKLIQIKIRKARSRDD